jgi:hypothetical protein
MKRILLIILFALPLSIYAEINTPSEQKLKKLLSLELRAGFIGTTWSPQGLATYEVETYSRSMMYAEVRLAHPFFVINEAFDFISFPSLRIDSNMGFNSEQGEFGQLIPAFITENPYMRTFAWMTVFEDISFRYRNEKYVVGLQEQQNLTIDGTPEVKYDETSVTNSIKEIEIGLIGSLDNDFKITIIELGYYRRDMNWPIVDGFYDSLTRTTTYVMNHRSIWMQGAYAALHLDLAWTTVPLTGQLYLHIGNATGFDLRLKYESRSTRKISFGGEAEGSFKRFSAYHENSEFDKTSRINTPTETRFRISIYSKFSIF